MSYAHWSDVMGNDLSAAEVHKTFLAQRNSGESFASWLERQSKEMWGSDHSDENWTKMSDEIKAEALR